jgi:hypothetical protein
MKTIDKSRLPFTSKSPSLIPSGISKPIQSGLSDAINSSAQKDMLNINPWARMIQGKSPISLDPEEWKRGATATAKFLPNLL